MRSNYQITGIGRSRPHCEQREAGGPVRCAGDYLHRPRVPANPPRLALSLLLLLTALPVFVGRAAAAPANRVTITNQSGSAQSSRPLTISRVFARGEIANYPQAVVNGTAVLTQADVKTRWPDGSVQHALVSFVAALPASGSIPVDFVNQPSGNNSGFMTRTDILAATWGAQMELTNGNTAIVSARQIVTDWNGTAADQRVRYWRQGPVCTQVILEDRNPSLAYDIGWDNYKPLHPIFVVTFYPAAPNSTRVEMIVENMWATKLEDQSYSLTLKTGTSLSVAYSKPAFTHYAMTRWRKDLWSGTALPAIAVDYNLAYLVYSQVLPSYDLSKSVPQSTVNGLATAFAATDQGDINGNGLWLKYMPQTGGRDDIGLFPTWYVQYLYTFAPTLYPMLLGNGEVAGHVPIHSRESDSTLKFDDLGQVSAFGRPFSIDAHPSGGAAPVAPLSNGHGWTPDIAHVGSMSFVPYIITGDWYWLEELYMYASWVLRTGDPGNLYYGRNGSWGIIPYILQTRAVAWGMRELAHAAFAAPDNTPEKTYFTQKMSYNIAAREGEQNLTTGAFYDPTPGSKWYWGRNTMGEGLQNPLFFLDRGDAYGAPDELNTSAGSPYAVLWGDSPWQYNYTHIVYGHIDELGFPITKLRQRYLVNLLHQLQDPAYNPYLAGAYRLPVRQKSTNTYFQTWSDTLKGYDAAHQTVTSWPENDESDVNHGYPHILQGATSFIIGVNDGSLSGQNAWNWVSTHVADQDLLNYNPKWAFVPRGSAGSTPPAPTPPPVTVSRCDLNGDGVVDAQDVQLAINQALGIQACTADLDGNGHCDVVDAQRVITAALGGICKVGQ